MCIRDSDSASYNWKAVDSVRGKSQNATTYDNLYVNLTNGQNTDNVLSAINANSIDFSSGGNGNTSGLDYIGYSWKAGGLPSINTDGTISSIVSANQSAGISVVKFGSSSSASTNVGHGLGAIPQFIIAKRLDSTSNWAIQAPVLGNGYMLLNTNGVYQGSDASIWNDTAPTSSVFTTAGGSGTFFNACLLYTSPSPRD